MSVWVRERFPLYARACLMSAMVLVPAMFLKSTLGVFSVVKLSVLWALMMVALALWAGWRLDEGRPAPRSKALRYGGAFLAVSAIATALSPYRVTALLGHYFVNAGLVSLALYFLAAFLVFALYWSRPGALEELCRAGAAAAFVVTGYQLIQEVGLDWHSWLLLGRLAPWEGGALGNPNFTGGFLGATLPFSLYLIFNSKDRGRRQVLTAATILHVGALWLTASRGGLAAGFASAAVVASPHLKSVPARVRRRAATAAAAVVIVAAVAAVWVNNRPVPPGAEPTLLGISVSPKASLETRLDFWKAAVGIIGDHPILGTGPDTYYANYPAYRPPENGADPTLQLENNPHNIFLAHAVGSGLVGLAAFLLVLGYVLRLAFRGLRSIEDDRLRLLLLTFTAVLCGYVAQGLVSIDHIPLAMLAWVSFGAIAAIAEPHAVAAREGDDQKVSLPRRGGRRSLRSRETMPVTIALASALLLLAVSGRFILADIKASQSVRAGDPTEKLELFRKVFRLNPFEAEYHHAAGAALHNLASTTTRQPESRDRLIRQARSEFHRALTLRPDSVVYLVSLARLESAWGQTVHRQHFVTAADTWRRAISLDPNNYRWHYFYGRMLGLAADADNNNRQLRLAQIDELRRSIDIYRNQPEAWEALATSYRQLGDVARADAVRAEFFGPESSSEANVDGVPSVPEAAPAPSPFRRAVGSTLAAGAITAAALAGIRTVLVGARTSQRRAKKQRGIVPDHPGELLLGAAILCLALAVPYAGLLLGVGMSEGELRELLVHVVPGVAALVTAVLYSARPYAGVRAPTLSANLPLATFVVSLVAAVIHLPELFQAGSASRALGVLLHLAPLIAIFALASVTINRRPQPISQQAGKRVRESADIA